MAMRLQELHPALVHYPLAFLPTAIVADLLGKLTRNHTLLEVGRWGIVAGAASGVVAGAAGLLAQEEVVAEGRARDMLITHRNINIALNVSAVLMAVSRVQRRRPTWRYLITGFAALGALTYSAYLGGHMAYELGVGVRAAGGVRPDTPELRRFEGRWLSRRAARKTLRGLRHVAADTVRGEIAPELTGRSAEH